MDSKTDTYDNIKNRACLVCGACFSRPRAGKFYCSAKCKQFTIYHKQEILALKASRIGINDSIIKLSLKEYELYVLLTDKLHELKDLRRRRDSSFKAFDEQNLKRLEELEKTIPNYLKKLRLPNLSIEKWSFLKMLYPKLKKDDFNKLISNLQQAFFESLEYSPATGKKEMNNPIKLSFQNHLKKMGEGKIIFI